MGSYNGTCAFSLLPIGYEDPVVVIITLAEDPGSYQFRRTTQLVYPNDWFDPISLPIFGRYNDYGTIDSIESNLHHANILKVLGKNEDETLEELLDRISRQKEEVQLSGRDVGFSIIRRDIYDFLITNTGNQDPVCWKQEPDQTLEEIIKETEVYLEDVIPKLKQIENPHDNFRMYSKIFSAESEDHYLLQFLSALGGGAFNVALNKMRYYEQMMEAAVEGDLSFQKEYISLAAEMFLLCQEMMINRRSWTPKCGGGSQTSGWRMHRAIAQKVIDICNQKDQEDLRQMGENVKLSFVLKRTDLASSDIDPLQKEKIETFLGDKDSLTIEVTARLWGSYASEPFADHGDEDPVLDPEYPFSFRIGPSEEVDYQDIEFKQVLTNLLDMESENSMEAFLKRLRQKNQNRF